MSITTHTRGTGYTALAAALPVLLGVLVFGVLTAYHQLGTGPDLGARITHSIALAAHPAGTSWNSLASGHADALAPLDPHSAKQVGFDLFTAAVVTAVAGLFAYANALNRR